MSCPRILKYIFIPRIKLTANQPPLLSILELVSLPGGSFLAPIEPFPSSHFLPLFRSRNIFPARPSLGFIVNRPQTPLARWLFLPPRVSTRKGEYGRDDRTDISGFRATSQSCTYHFARGPRRKGRATANLFNNNATAEKKKRRRRRGRK